LNIFDITFEPETLETRSGALKTRILAQNPIKLLATILAGWIGDDVIKIQAKHTPRVNQKKLNKPKSFDLVKIWSKSLIRDVKSVKTFAKSVKFWANSLKIQTKIAPNLI